MNKGERVVNVRGTLSMTSEMGLVVFTSASIQPNSV